MSLIHDSLIASSIIEENRKNGEFLLVPNYRYWRWSKSVIGLVIAEHCSTIIDLIDLLINFYAVVVVMVFVCQSLLWYSERHCSQCHSCNDCNDS
jgi:hypothetical protein